MRLLLTPPISGGGYRLSMLTSFEELFLKVELDWMERIQVRVGGGEALVVHPSPVLAIPEPERKGTGLFHPLIRTPVCP